MDPLSLGIAAAALIATKGAESFAAKAGEALWGVVNRIYTAVAGCVTDSDARLALEATANSGPHSTEAQALLARAIARSVSDSHSFREQIAALVEEAGQDKAGALIVAKSFDQSKQVNFGGNNFGPINL